MNQLTKEIITELLQDENAWDKKTRELRYDVVLENYREIRAARFDEEVMLPRLKRAERMLSVWFGLELNDEGWLEDWEVCDALSNQLCGNSMYNVVGYPIKPGLRERDFWRESYFSKIWESPEWEIETPSQAEILALGIVPNQVPAKQNQPSLF